MKRLNKTRLKEINLICANKENLYTKINDFIASKLEDVAKLIRKGDLHLTLEEMMAMHYMANMEVLDLESSLRHTGMSKTEFYNAIAHGYFPAGHKMGRRRDASRTFWFRQELNEGLWKLTHN